MGTLTENAGYSNYTSARMKQYYKMPPTDRQTWFFELEEAADGLALRAVALCNGTLYKSKEQRLGRNREQLAAALCLHSLAARLVTLMYNQRKKAYDVITQRNDSARGCPVASLGSLWRWLDLYGRRVDWNSGNVKERWQGFAYSLLGIICDLDEIRPAEASPFYYNYAGKFDVIYQIATNCNAVDGLPGMIPETLPAQQLSLF